MRWHPLLLPGWLSFAHCPSPSVLSCTEPQGLAWDKTAGSGDCQTQPFAQPATVYASVSTGCVNEWNRRDFERLAFPLFRQLHLQGPVLDVQTRSLTSDSTSLGGTGSLGDS